jgi:hypothetical protein
LYILLIEMYWGLLSEREKCVIRDCIKIENNKQKRKQREKSKQLKKKKCKVYILENLNENYELFKIKFYKYFNELKKSRS